MPRDYNMGTLQVSMGTPARAASSVKIKGTVELFVPTRDPNAIVKIDKALSKLDTPLSSKALKAAKVTITPLSPEGYAAAKKANKLDEKKIAEIRAEGKKQGVPEKEIEMAIELAKAFENLDGDTPEGAVILSGTKSDFDRIFRVEILGADGKQVSTGNRSTSTRGESTVMTIQPSEPLPPNAALEIYLLTDKPRHVTLRAECATAMRTTITIALALFAASVVAQPKATPVEVSIKQVNDRRTSGSFSQLTISLELPKISSRDVEASRVLIAAATDDSGRSLVDPEAGEPQLDPNFRGSLTGRDDKVPPPASVNVTLKNPDRRRRP